MKSFIKAFVLVALVAAIGFSMASCIGGGLSGTRWVNDVGGYGFAQVYLKFTGSNYTAGSIMMGSDMEIDSGTYKFDGKKGTLSSPRGPYNTATFGVSGNKLTLYARAGYDESDTVFTKQ